MTTTVKFGCDGETLRRYYKSRARVSFIMGPLGSGKTIMSCQKMLKLMSEQKPNKINVRPTRWFAVRNTYSELFSSTIKDWLGLFGSIGKFKQGNKEPPNWSAKFILDDKTIVDAELLFIALDRAEHVRKIRGTQFTGGWLNEVKELQKAVVDMIHLRIGRYPSLATGGVKASWKGLIGDTNAPDQDHWYYKLAEEQKPDNWEFFKQPGGVLRTDKKDNLGRTIFVPNHKAENLKHLTDGVNYYVDGMQAKDEDWIAVNLANEYGFLIDGKPVYPEYNDRVHCPAEGVPLLKHLPLCIGWDFGLTPCIVLIQLTDRGQLRIIDELVAENMSVKSFARDCVKPFLLKYLRYTEISLSIADPAGAIRHETDAQASINMLNDIPVVEHQDQFTPLGMGFFTEPAPSNSVERRHQAVKEYLCKMVDGKPGLLLDKKCKKIRKGFNGGYKYRKLQVAGDARYKETPDKNEYSHPHDALQYAALGALSGMICDRLNMEIRVLTA